MDHPEQYKVKDEALGGNLHSILDDIPYISIRYAKRKLKNGNYSIGVILSDLAHISIIEQKYWESFEIVSPRFAINDQDFQNYIDRYIKGKWDDFKDPLKLIIKKIREINTHCVEEKLFRNDKNKYIRYPVNNTLNDFNECTLELFKLISSDNISSICLKKFLSDKFNLDSNHFTHSDSLRPLSPIQLLELLVDKTKPQVKQKVIKSIKKIGEARTVKAHKVLSEDGNDNYVEIFRLYCQELFEGLQELESIISKL